ncbi:MAG TPA: HEAT repeat domain-containing protein, partial [Prosthecobacter sp.]
LMMKKNLFPLSFASALLTTLFLASLATLPAVTPQELAQKYKPLPTVAEKDLPPMPNKVEKFPGAVKHAGLEGRTWVRFPFVENPGSFGIDRKGRLFVAEVNRFWQGVPDLRGINEFIRGDFQSQTVADRAKLYNSIPGRVPEGFYTNTADRLIRLEDRDGNGAADHRTLFSDDFHEALDGIGFSVLPEDDAVYFTCIPSLRKLTDANDDGIADKQEALVTGFGVRVSFIGHDLHGIVRGPDGRLYFSIGDRGYSITTKDGRLLAGPGTGAIFRCESDGSGIEVFCTGLRNPTELVFDELGNLFTFDNTGDIGDKARMVYALEGSDSGWDMRHQSAHQYVNALDWGDFHPAKSMWVAERMFDTFNTDQPQSVYPPAAHVSRGPSGVTLATGSSLPEDVRGKFLLTDYGGAVTSCNLLSIGVKPAGAGYTLASQESLATGVGISDVELGFDGNIYLCDFGGGWSINNNGAIHVLAPTDKALKDAGAKSAVLFNHGLADANVEHLAQQHLRSIDRRLRQMAQFELVKRGAEGHAALLAVAKDGTQPVATRLHGVWALGQIARQSGGKVAAALLELSRDGQAEIRANAARTLGDGFKDAAVRPRLLEMLKDDSTRVRSLAAIALSRVAGAGDAEAIAALYEMGAANGKDAATVDPVLRHAALSALDVLGTEKSAVAHASDANREARLLSLISLRRRGSAELMRFLKDADPQLRIEAIRAIYDTSAVDGPAGEAISAIDVKQAASLPPTVQRRIVAANYRRGTAANAQHLLEIARADTLDLTTREAALHALRLWEKTITTDPVLGGYRPLPSSASKRSMQELGSGIGAALRAFLASKPPQKLTTLALKLADDTGLVLAESTLKDQIANAKLDAAVRVAALDSLVKSSPDQARAIVAAHLADASPEVAASALRHGLAMKVEGIADAARAALDKAPPAAARAGVEIIATLHPSEALDRWQKRDDAKTGLRRELWLDLFLALQTSPDKAAQEKAAAYAATSVDAIPLLTTSGGDVKRGDVVFRNQGACLQCHKVGSEGGIQGPPLTTVAERVKPEKLVESLINPNAEIAQGYGLSSITLQDGSLLAGRIAKEDKDALTLITLDNKENVIPRAKVKTIAPPVSAMPPMGLSLPPRDLRDLIAFLTSRTTANAGKDNDAASHGDSHGDEKIAK